MTSSLIATRHAPTAQATLVAAKKILVVTAATGAGHDSVATSLVEAFDRLGNRQIRVKKVDLLAEGGRRWMAQVGRLYPPIIVRYPRLWGLVYAITNNDNFWRLSRTMAEAIRASAIGNFLSEQAPDVIICVHPLCNQIIAQSLRRAERLVPLTTVITDLYEAHAAWIAPEVSRYVSPTEEVQASLSAKGVTHQQIKSLGLPLDRRFSSGWPDPQGARLIMGLDEKAFTLLLTGGGEGAGAITSVAQALSDARLPVQLIVACGRNEALKQKLKRCSLAMPHRILGFQDNMALLFQAADVIIGKAGALTIGEAVAAQRPLILISPLPGQEKGNVQFVLRRGVGRIADSISSLIQILKKWLSDPVEIEELVAQGESLRREWSQAATRVAAATLESVTQREIMVC